MKKSVRSLVAVAVVAVGVLGVSGSAMAAAPTGSYVDFKYCPYMIPSVTQCVYSKTTSGSFKLGNANVPITSSTPLILQGGLIDPGDGSPQQFVPAVGADSLSKTPLKVPGGLIGLVDTGGFGGFLISLFNAAVASVNDVYATAEPVGAPVFSAANTLSQSGTAVGLPVRIHLENPFLGSNCYIGSPSNPVQLNLTTGTTSPPAPNTPISGTRGTVSFTDDFTITKLAGLKLVNNSFSAPAASGCGFTILDQWLITGAVNLKEGLPSASGNNAAIMQGDTKLAGAAAVAASVQ
jgi:hypothetical protein